MEGVDLAGLAIGEVLVPVDAVSLVGEAGLDAGVALVAVLLERGQVVALVHAGAVGHRADELLLAGAQTKVQR